MTPVLALDDVTVVRDGRTALDGVSLAVEPGEIVAVAGPSGAGKTSLLRVVLGLARPARGVVRLRGTEVSRDGRILVPPEDRGLAMVFQDLALWPHLSVHGNVAFALDARAAPRQDRDRRVAAALDRVGLGALAARLPATLSGGERQRVAIARALVTDPDLVLFDEALTSLDVALKEEVLALLEALFRERGCAALVVSHDPREARRLAAKVTILEAARVVQTGTLEELARDPRTAFVRAFAAAT